MTRKNVFDTIRKELETGIELTKCRSCGCMRDALEHCQAIVSGKKGPLAAGLADLTERGLSKLQPKECECRGCEVCHGADIINLVSNLIPYLPPPKPGDVNVGPVWPPLPGEYFVVGISPDRPVAVSTLASVDMAQKLARKRPPGLSIVGKTETENIGVEKVVKNILANPYLRVLLVVGNESKGHLSGLTFAALWENGVNAEMKVKGSPGRNPYLKNITPDEVQAFRSGVRLVDMSGCTNLPKILRRIKMLSLTAGNYSGNRGYAGPSRRRRISSVPVMPAGERLRITLDCAGYFVILVDKLKGEVVVEHYSNYNKLLHVVAGKSARALYLTIIENGWVTQLSHAAYLGKELTRAELAIRKGTAYVQDGA